MADIAQIAWSQDDDVYGFNDNLILKGSEYCAKYNFTNLTIPFQSYTNCDGVNHTINSESARGGIRPIWSSLYNHYVKRKGLSETKARFTKIAQSIVQIEGGGGDYGGNSGGFDTLGFGTLMYTL